MRKITVLAMITLDGVIQAPGGPEEDLSGNFEYGGWTKPFGDETYGKVVKEELDFSDYLLGRKTFDIWADYWPHHGEFWPGINAGNKYIFSNSLSDTDPRVIGWNNTKIIRDIEEVKKIKASAGAPIQVWGSSELVPLLLNHDLVDELRLKIHPLLLGNGKKLFTNGVIPAAFSLQEHTVTSTGVIIASFKREGEVATGSY
ncbi:dihydrofolate reductase family protein [Robertkochia solimangrovi]|uniref:dihydrofolate reductase family protein n=1 Tax=Robertkochia solimangrovi TaxID=2213046 RepID=UPI001180D7CD|nr:dihydrofolate reductase family protein [Robertkochia solimangrovi]TRZ46334.1 dihydrofolate reductase [Robertkochia solimangrovi]